MNGEVESLEALIGAAAREIRSGAGVTLDQLASRARERGLRWSTARVIEFEKGSLRVTLPMLLVVVQSLSELTRTALTLRDLLPDLVPWVKVTDTWTVKLVQLVDVLDGGVVNLGDVAHVAPAAGREITVLHSVAEITPTLAETRAARRLGISPRDLTAVAHLMWGRHLDDEVAARAESGASPQARGHMTRRLVDDLAERAATIDVATIEYVPVRTRLSASAYEIAVRVPGGEHDGDR